MPPTARLNICKQIPMNILQCTKTQNMPLQRFNFVHKEPEVKLFRMLTFEHFSSWRVISEHAKIVCFLYSPESLLYHQSLPRLPSHQFGISWPTPLQPSCLCGSSLATWWLSNAPTVVSPNGIWNTRVHNDVIFMPPCTLLAHTLGFQGGRAFQTQGWIQQGLEQKVKSSIRKRNAHISS